MLSASLLFLYYHLTLYCTYLPLLRRVLAVDQQSAHHRVSDGDGSTAGFLSERPGEETRGSRHTPPPLVTVKGRVGQDHQRRMAYSQSVQWRLGQGVGR